MRYCILSYEQWEYWIKCVHRVYLLQKHWKGYYQHWKGYYQTKAFENIVGKGENDNQHFLHFPRCFLPIPERICFWVKFILLSENTYNLDESKILSFGKKLKVPILANKKVFVYKIKVNPIHTILKYGDYHDFMDR